MQRIVHYAGFVYILGISSKHVEHIHRFLKERTECDDDKDLDNIKTMVNDIIGSLAIVHCEFKKDEVTSQQCE